MEDISMQTKKFKIVIYLKDINDVIQEEPLGLKIML